MAGHSHSSNIRFRKDRVDAKRAKTFAKLSRMITVAARQGGGEVDGNPRLRLAVDKARVLSMSKEAIERAIKKGIGEGAGGHFEEVVYEGFGPGGVAFVLEILTDNRNRTAADVRMLFDSTAATSRRAGRRRACSSIAAASRSTRRRPAGRRPARTGCSRPRSRPAPRTSCARATPG
jgi:YebC/PmpR family DNA-binding regulatory protein